jgi:hypothetical protein
MLPIADNITELGVGVNPLIPCEFMGQLHGLLESGAPLDSRRREVMTSLDRGRGSKHGRRSEETNFRGCASQRSTLLKLSGIRRNLALSQGRVGGEFPRLNLGGRPRDLLRSLLRFRGVANMISSQRR